MSIMNPDQSESTLQLATGSIMARALSNPHQYFTGVAPLGPIMRSVPRAYRRTDNPVPKRAFRCRGGRRLIGF